MTCAQGLLRLLWGGAEVGVLRDWMEVLKNPDFAPFLAHFNFAKFLGPK